MIRKMYCVKLRLLLHLKPNKIDTPPAPLERGDLPAAWSGERQFQNKNTEKEKSLFYNEIDATSCPFLCFTSIFRRSRRLTLFPS